MPMKRKTPPNLFSKIRALRRRIKPLPKGETTKDLVNAGRRDLTRKRKKFLSLAGSVPDQEDVLPHPGKDNRP